MENKNSLLGQGLHSLLGTKKIEENQEIKSGVLEVAVDLIDPCSHQPRLFFDEEKLIELSQSIKENGIIQPLVVIKKDDGRFELIAGERRLRASKLAGLEKVPVIIKDSNQKDKSLLSLIENIQRSDLNCIEIAKGYKRVIEEFKLTQDELAKRIAVNRSSIANTLRILTLPVDIISNIEKGKISFGHAKILVSIKDPVLLQELSEKILKSDISVKKLSDLIKKNESDSSHKTEKPSEEIKVPHAQKELLTKINYNAEIKPDSVSTGKLVINYNSNEDLEKILILLQKN
jgi:ParB family chromosome partitioning protein